MQKTMPCFHTYFPRISSQDIKDMDLNDPDLAKAAVKIQATFRGYKTRAKNEWRGELVLPRQAWLWDPSRRDWGREGDESAAGTPKRLATTGMISGWTES